MSKQGLAALILFVCLFLFIGAACGGSGKSEIISHPTSTPVPILIPTPTPTETSVAQEQKPIAPDFTLDGFRAVFPLGDSEVTYRGLENVSLSDFRGKLVILDFWASWCPYCALQMPQVEAAYKQYKDKGLVILGVEMNSGVKDVKRFVEENDITFPVLLDKGEVAKLYEVHGLPTSFLIAPDGTIVKKFLGATHNWNSVAGAALIEKYLPITILTQNKEVAR